METPQRIIQEAAGLGLTLEAVSGKIVCSPRSRITSEVREKIKTHKWEILSLLDELQKREDASSDPETWDTFVGFFVAMEKAPHLWAAVKQYALRTLPPALVEALDQEHGHDRETEPVGQLGHETLKGS